MRTTGLATGLDTDTIIKQMLTPYQSRVDSAKQSKDIILLKQQLYRDVAKDINSLYSKYMDVNSTSNLLLSTNYKTSVFKSSNDLAVSAEGLAGAKVGNYKVNVTEVAKPAQITETASNLGDKKFDVLVNGKAVEINLIGDTDPAS
ncbi:MAG TPA: flagellar cap protein FliD, partial [Clostridium sp.]|nr:flagellar cap protein FliD [Clostridium sp.]